MTHLCIDSIHQIKWHSLPAVAPDDAVAVTVHGDPVEEHRVQDGGPDPRPEHLRD